MKIKGVVLRRCKSPVLSSLSHYLRLPGIYQADVLAVAQHVFSGGLTNYSYTLAPLLITLVLYLLQVGVYAVTRVKRRFHGLTYSLRSSS